MDILSVWYRHKVRLSLPPGRKAGWWCTCDGGALTDLDLHLWDEEGAGAAAHPSRAPVPETLSLHSCHLAFQGAWSFLTESGHIFLPNYMSFQPASDKTLVHLCVSMVCELTVGRRGYVRQLARRKPGLSSLSAKPWSSDPFVAISVVIFFVFYFRREVLWSLRVRPAQCQVQPRDAVKLALSWQRTRLLLTWGHFLASKGKEKTIRSALFGPRISFCFDVGGLQWLSLEFFKLIGGRLSLFHKSCEINVRRLTIPGKCSHWSE